MVQSEKRPSTAVVIPCFKVSKHILDVLNGIPGLIDVIYVVDDHCPEETGKLVLASNEDPRVKVLFCEKNLGVGGAVVLGYKEALKNGFDMVIKMDGDGQMEPEYLPQLIASICGGADYAKGNRFYYIKELSAMPGLRLAGNAALTFINKLVSGYWNIYDPTNGYTAVSQKALKTIDLDALSKRYFFESDMLYQLSLFRMLVEDVPMKAKYDEEESNLSIAKVLVQFPPLYANRFLKRIFYRYLLTDFNAGSVSLLLGFCLSVFGASYGLFHLISSALSNTATVAGTAILSATTLTLGVQFLMFFLYFDIQAAPKKASTALSPSESYF